jgi:hypothetical protein
MGRRRFVKAVSGFSIEVFSPLSVGGIPPHPEMDGEVVDFQQFQVMTFAENGRSYDQANPL